MWRQIRPAQSGVASEWRETRIAGDLSSVSDTLSKYVQIDAGVKTAVYGSEFISMRRNFVGDYREAQTLYKFYRPVVNGEFLVALNNISMQNLNGRALFESWLLSADVDIAALSWDNKPSPFQGDPTYDLRLFSHLSSANAVSLCNRNSSSGIGPTRHGNSIYKIDGRAGQYYAMLCRIVLKSGSLSSGASASELSANVAISGGITVITKRARSSYPVTNRSSSGTTRTLALGAGHPVKFGMQIEVSGVNGSALKYDTLTNGGAQLQTQRTVTFADATTIQYASLEGSLTEGTVAAPTGAVVKYN